MGVPYTFSSRHWGSPLKRLVVGAVAVASLVLGPAWAAGPGIASIESTTNKVTAKIDLPGNIKADLEITFEQAVGLTVDSIGLSARLVDPSDLALLARLPSSVTIPAAFPVIFAIEPPSNGPLSFSGIASIDLHTHNLTYLPGTPLRLFVAPNGKGSFCDITASMGLGSYRTGANKGGFSEFLVVADLRAINGVIDEKFKRLQGLLESSSRSIPSAVLPTLLGQLADARNLYYNADNPAGASDKIQLFADTVKQNSGAGIPDVWRSSRDVVNVAGDLRSAASTLKFSLILKASGGS
jgi:hypothetical protein